MACGYNDIVNDIETCGGQRAVKGIEAKSWIANVGNLIFTKSDNLISSVAKADGKRAYIVDSLKDQVNIGHEGKISQTNATGYMHAATIIVNAKTAAARLQMDTMDNIVQIVETNGSKTEGCFLAYGVDFGMWKTADTAKANDNNALRTLEFASQEGMEEDFSAYVVWDTDYATTLAMLEYVAS